MRSRIERMSWIGLAFSISVIALGAPLFAAGPSPVPTPEIDGSSIGTALGLIAASVVMVRAFRRSK
jgi:hypothetical protein